jgi:hypothetical protein
MEFKRGIDMANIELVIKIHEKDYQSMKNGHIPFSILDAIMKGTPLPKGHGDLIDRDKLVYDCSLGDGGCDHICHCDGCSYHIIRETDINKAPIIVKTNKGE